MNISISVLRLLFRFKGTTCLAIILVGAILGSCSKRKIKLPPPPPPPPMTSEKNDEMNYQTVRKQALRSRSTIPSNRTRYEGSLWRDESSWGNLLRDHRARFKNDVVTITGMQDIISIEKSDPTPIPKPIIPAGETQAGQAAEILQALAAASAPSQAEKEQNAVLRSIKTLSARVQSVLPNGNMVIIAEKIDYRKQSTVRYITKVKGIIRPEDVTSNNEVPALRLARSEVQVKRQVQSKKNNYNRLAPLIGKKKAGLLDRLSHAATPQKGKAVTPVNTK